MQRKVKYACGDVQIVTLVGTPPACEDPLRLLRRSLCPTCQRRSRYVAAYQCAVEAGLLPLHADNIQHLALAEIVRASLWRALLPADADDQASQFVVELFNQRLSASFWLSLRGIVIDRLTPTRRGSLLLSLQEYA